MEQLDMFEMELDETQRLFKKFDLDLEHGQSYVVTAKTCKVMDDIQDNVKVIGILIKYDNHEIALGNAWIEDNQQNGRYTDLVIFSHKQIQKIETPLPFDFKINFAYRAEIYRTNPVTGRPTNWISCYYRGMTHSGKIMLVGLGNNSEIFILNRRDIKGFFQLSLDEIKIILEKEEIPQNNA